MAIAVDANGYLAVTGNASSGINFGDGWLPAGGPNYWVASFTIDGSSPPVCRWAKGASGGSSFGMGIAFDTLGHILTVGIIKDTVDFGGRTAAGPGLTGAAFVAQYNK